MKSRKLMLICFTLMLNIILSIGICFIAQAYDPLYDPNSGFSPQERINRWINRTNRDRMWKSHMKRTRETQRLNKRLLNKKKEIVEVKSIPGVYVNTHYNRIFKLNNMKAVLVFKLNQDNNVIGGVYKHNANPNHTYPGQPLIYTGSDLSKVFTKKQLDVIAALIRKSPQKIINIVCCVNGYYLAPKNNPYQKRGFRGTIMGLKPFPTQTQKAQKPKRTDPKARVQNTNKEITQVQSIPGIDVYARYNTTPAHTRIFKVTNMKAVVVFYPSYNNGVSATIYKYHPNSNSYNGEPLIYAGSDLSRVFTRQQIALIAKKIRDFGKKIPNSNQKYVVGFGYVSGYYVTRRNNTSQKTGFRGQMTGFKPIRE